LDGALFIGNCSPAKAGVQHQRWNWPPAFAGERSRALDRLRHCSI